jgi:trimethylamine:corrinoid methyltransferase-like protein
MPGILSLAAPFVKESSVFRNEMPRYEILSEDAMETLDRGWRRIVTELGVEFALPEAVEYFEKAGQRVEGEKVFLDPEFVLEQVAKAPSEFELQARNPEHTVHIGGDHMVFAGVYGPPFVRRGEQRGDATSRTSRTSSASGRRSPRWTPPAAPSSSPRTGRSTPATSTWCTRSRRCRTSPTWAR